MTDPLQLPDVPGFSWRLVWTWTWVLLLSGWGGVVHFWRKRRDGRARPFNFTELIGEVITSAFAGVLTYLLCTYAGMPSALTAAMVGVSGHMGARALFAMERVLERRYPMFGADDDTKGS